MVFEVEANDQELKISVRDNGKGIGESEDTRFRRGLKSMERRMGLVEGCIEMRSPECGGTDVEFRVPLNGGSGYNKQHCHARWRCTWETLRNAT